MSNIICEPQKTNLPALLKKCSEIGIKFSENAFAIPEPEYHPDKTKLEKRLIFGYDQCDRFYINAMEHNKSWNIYTLEVISVDGYSEYEFCASFEDAYLHICNTSDRADDIDSVVLEGGIVNFFVDKCIVATVKKVNASDYYHVDNKISKRFEKAFKGISSATSNKVIKRKLKGFQGLSTAKVKMKYDCDGSDVFPHWKSNNLYMPKINNYVLQMKNIINCYAIEEITLSQAQILFMAYFNIKNWHILVKNEKRLGRYSPYMVCHSIGEDDSIYIAQNFAEGLYLMDKLIRENKGDYELSSYGTEIIASNNHEDASIRLFNSYLALDDVSFDDPKMFNQENSLLETLKKISESMKNNQNKIYKKIGKIDNMRLDVFEKKIEDKTFYLTLGTCYGIAILGNADSKGMNKNIVEYGNVSIGKDENGNMALCRDINEPRIDLNFKSEESLEEFKSSFGIGDGFFNDLGDEIFLKSEAGKAFAKWHEKHPETKFGYGEAIHQIGYKELAAMIDEANR